MPRAIFGVLIECDPSIKSIIMEIDSAKNNIIVEDIDDQHLVVKENMVAYLKEKLDQRLKETQNEQNSDNSGSD